MNKHSYRIVFNQSRGCLMVVAENATSQGKSAIGERAGVGNASASCTFTAIAWACKLMGQAVFVSAAALGFAPLQTQAQTVATRIVADPTAARTQQATVLNTSNGVLQVNIQTPSAAGVSRNTFNQFDVGSQGAILNNSRTNVQTQLGGWVQGNPWLATGSARVILNEVNSSNPSQLQGFVEVAGQRAEVIVANPAGIAVNGAGFINASGVTLTTGTPALNNGNLDSYRVQRGTVSVDGQGLDTRTADYTAILARAAQVNAGIWAKQLQVVTGANEIHAPSVGVDVTPQTTALAGSGALPAYALDVSTLGGMYTGKITLIGTEAGLGVRNAGSVQAASGPLTLNSEGWLQNSGTLQASGGDVNIQTLGTVEQSGTVYSDTNVLLASQANQTHSGTVAALGNVSIRATGHNSNGNVAQIAATQTAVWVAGLQADGQLTGQQNLNVQASGQIQTAGKALATDTLYLQTAQALVTDGAKVQAQALNISAHSLSNIAGQLLQTGSSDQSIDLLGSFNNTAGVIQTSANHLSISAQSIDNTAGQLLHAGSGTFSLSSQGALANNTQSSTQAADTDGARIVSSGSLNIASVDWGNSGSVYAAKDVTATATSLNNNGTLYAAGAQTLTVTDAISSSGSIAAAKDLGVTATRFSGSSTSVLAAGMAADGRLTGTGSLTLNTTSTLQSAGQVLSTGNVNLEGSSLDLRGTSMNGSTTASVVGSTAGDLSLTASAGNIQTSNAQLSTPGLLAITANSNASQMLDNHNGQLSAAQLDIRSGQLNNTQGQIQQTGTGVQTARIQTAGAIDNSGGAIVANAQDFRLSAGGNLNNTDGQIGHAGAGTFTLSAAAADNTHGKLLGNGTLSLTATSNVDNTNGLVTAQSLGLSATDWNNSQGKIYAGQDASLSTGVLTNDQGELSAGRHLQITTATAATPALNISNAAGQIVADTGVSVTAGSLSGAGTLASRGDVSLSLQGNHTLAGTLQAGGNLSLAATGQITNPISVQAGQNLSVSAQSLDNQAAGELISGQTTNLRITDTLTNRGLIDGADTRIQAGSVNNRGTGRIYGDRVAIAAGTLTNQEETLSGVTTAATIAGREHVDIGAQTLTNRENALIYSGGDMALGGALDANWRAIGSAQLLNNNSATIEAAQNLSVQATSLRNTNEHFASEVQQTSQTQNTEYQHQTGDVYRVSDISTRFAPADTSITNCQATCMTTTAGTSDAFVRYDYSRTVQESVVTQSAPGSILAGGGITLTASNVLNDKSQIVAGGALNVQATTVNNDGGQGTRITTDAGTATSYWRNRNKGTDSTGSSTSPYNPAPVEQTLSLSAARYEQNTANASTGTAPTANTLSTVSAQASTAGAVAALAPTASQSAVTGSTANAATGVSTATRTSAASAQTGLRTLQASSQVPNTSLYRQHPESNARYLVETDPKFANYKTWLGSDYMLNALNLDPATTQKRLGDGFYEQKLIREQVMALTGNRFLGDYTNDEQEYMALMNSGLTYAKQFNLRPGIALNADQIAQLTSDMVWLVSQDVTLADGSVQSVLVPQVYVRVRPGDLDGTGALLSGKDVQLNLSGDLTNSGTIAGRNLLQINANNIQNLGGQMSADTLALAAKEDINNIGGLMQGVSAAVATAGRDLNLTTTVQSGLNKVGANSFAQTGIDRVAGLYVSGPAGVLLASAGRDLNLTAAQIQNAGTGSSILSAGHNLNLNTVTTSNSQDINWSGVNYLRQSQSQDVGSQINAAGNLTLRAGQNINAKAAAVNAGQALNVNAGQNVNITTGQASQNLDTANTVTSKGTLSSRTLSTRETSQSTTALASDFEGNSVNIKAGQDLTVKGSNVLADQSVNLTAGGNVNITAAQNTQTQSSFRQETKSGLMSGGGIGFTVGKREQSLDQGQTQTSAAGSTIGSTGGNVSISAGKTYTQTGSDVLTPQGDIAIAAKTVDINEARETGSQSTEQKFKQSGLTVALSGGVIDTAQAAMRGIQGATGGGSDRSKALNALIAYGKGADLYEQGKAVSDAYDKNGVLGNTGTDGKTNPGAAAASGIKVSISAGSSSSQSNSNTSTKTGAGSTVKAGGNVNIKATGQGDGEGNLTIQGSNVSATKTVNLSATQNVDILASADTESNRSTNKSSAASVGMSFGVGAGSAGLSLDIAASKGKGQANAESTSYTNSQIEASQKVSITSGADTNVVGGSVKANQVTADVGGNLNVESLQDKAVSEANQKTTGVALSIPITGAGGSASISQAKQNSNSNYASVNEQSGIQAGDGGFQVDVKNNTELKGAVIASNASADKNSLNTSTLTTSDLNNTMSASASSSGTTVGTNMLSGKYELGKAVVGNALNSGGGNQNDASTTKTAISAAQVTVSGKTTDTSKDALTDSNGKAVIGDTNAPNRTLAKADVAGLQQQAQQKQADNMLAFKAAVAFTDPTFKAAFLDQAKMYKKVTGTAPEGKPTTQWQEMTPEEKAKIPPGSRVANNGIFNGGPNDPKPAQDLAQQNSSDAADYLVHFPQANNKISELLVAGYQKFMEGGTLGLTNATQQNVDLWNQTGGNVTLDGHSRGGMTVGNALTAVQEQGGAGGKTNVNLFGSAYNAQDAANTVNKITSGSGQVTSQVHKDDFVGTVLGGNAVTGGTTPSGSSTLQEWIRMLGGDSTSHNNYGDGKDEKGIKDYWGGVQPVPQPVKPTNVLPTLPIGEGK